MCSVIRQQVFATFARLPALEIYVIGRTAQNARLLGALHEEARHERLGLSVGFIRLTERVVHGAFLASE